MSIRLRSSPNKNLSMMTDHDDHSNHHHTMKQNDNDRGYRLVNSINSDNNNDNITDSCMNRRGSSSNNNSPLHNHLENKERNASSLCHWDDNNHNINDPHKIQKDQQQQDQLSSSTVIPVPSEPVNNNNNWCFIIQMTLISSMGGILFGYDIGIISSALPLMITEFTLDNMQSQWIVSILYVGSCIGALTGGIICDTYGRKYTIMMTDIIFILGGYIMYISSSLYMIYIGRIIIGYGVAVSGIADVSYLHEMSPNHIRGAIVSVNEACISLGFLISFAVGSYITHHTNDNDTSGDGWRLMFGCSAFFAIIQMIGMLSLPESPIWIAQQQNHQQELQQQIQQRKHANNDILFNSQDSDDSEYELATKTKTTATSSCCQPMTDSIIMKIDVPMTTATTTKLSPSLVTAPHSPSNRLQERSNQSNNYHSTSIVNDDDDDDDHHRIIKDTNKNCGSSNKITSPSTYSHDFLLLNSPGRNNLNYDDDNNSNNVINSMKRLYYRINTINMIICQYMKSKIMSGYEDILSFYIIMTKQYRYQTYITFFLSILQQLCGQTNVISYAPIILQQVSMMSSSSNNYTMTTTTTNNDYNVDDTYDNDNSMMSSFISMIYITSATILTSTVSIGIVKFIVTVFVIWKIDVIGRRLLLLIGMGIISIGLLLLSISFMNIVDVNVIMTKNADNNNVEEEVVEETINTKISSTQGLALPGILLVVTGYSMSFGPLTWLITSELYPSEIRGRALGLSTIITYICAILVTSTFLSIQHIIGSSTLYICYMIITLIGIVYAYYTIPDTGGNKTVDEIHYECQIMMNQICKK